jgi:hypothetical protein
MYPLAKTGWFLLRIKLTIKCHEMAKEWNRSLGIPGPALEISRRQTELLDQTASLIQLISIF